MIPRKAVEQRRRDEKEKARHSQGLSLNHQFVGAVPIIHSGSQKEKRTSGAPRPQKGWSPLTVSFSFSFFVQPSRRTCRIDSSRLVCKPSTEWHTPDTWPLVHYHFFIPTIRDISRAFVSSYITSILSRHNKGQITAKTARGLLVILSTREFQLK